MVKNDCLHFLYKIYAYYIFFEKYIVLDFQRSFAPSRHGGLQ